MVGIRMAMCKNHRLWKLEVYPCHLLDYLLCLSHRVVEKSNYENPCRDLD